MVNSAVTEAFCHDLAAEAARLGFCAFGIAPAAQDHGEHLDDWQR